MKFVTRVYLIYSNAEKVTRDLLADDMMCSNRERPTTLVWSGKEVLFAQR